jgi:DMSO/TMAO reductase YedYZ molybdopterin-dependent catalytic subunit
MRETGDCASTGRWSGRSSLTSTASRPCGATTFTAVVECAGNGRVYYVPLKEGWQTGAVGNAAWTGVILREILEMAGVRGTAREVLLVGADSGVIDTNMKTASPGPIAFARSLPLEKAIADGTILAYSMNDEPLTRDHGVRRDFTRQSSLRDRPQEAILRDAVGAQDGKKR